MIKSLKRNDIRYTPFIANKSWNVQNQRFEDLISWQSGSESGSLLLTFLNYEDGTRVLEISSAYSSALAYQQQDPDFARFSIGKNLTGSTFYPVGSRFYSSETNPLNIDESYQSLVYNTKKNLYYKESENPTQIFGLESLDSSFVNRTLPSKISVFNIPLNKFGEKIEPESVKINDTLANGNVTVIDDGNNNLKISGSNFSNIQSAEYNCVSASIIHTNLNQIYDGTPKSASVSTNPPNLNVLTKYNGSLTAPADFGIYSIFSEIVDGFYCGTKSDILNIGKKSATVSVTSVSNAYNGSRHDVIVSTTPSNLNYSIEYTIQNGTVKKDPIEVGFYSAIVTINDSNYSGTGTGTSTITPQNSNLEFNSISNITYGDIWEITPIATDTINNFPIVFTITSGNTLAEIVDNKVSLNPSKTATSLGSVTVTATTVPNIFGYSPVSLSRTFTINTKKLTLSNITVLDQIVGSGTTVSINNSNTSLSGILPGDNVTIASSPTTGTISIDYLGVYYVNLSSNYTITGTHVLKYSLQQPNLNAKVIANKIIFNSKNSFVYDSYEWSIKDILTTDSLNSIENLIVDYYRNDTNERIGGEKYIKGILISKDNQRPIDVGVYTVKVKSDELIVDEEKTKNITITKAQAFVTLNNLVQGGIFYISYDNRLKILPLSEEILPVIVTNVSIRDRNNKLISLPDLIKFTSVLYNNSTTKPTSVGSYNVNSILNSKNVYSSNTQTMRIQDFVYIVTNDLYEIEQKKKSIDINGNIIFESAMSDYLINDFTSSTYNFKKYFDPSVTGSWSSIVSTYPILSGFNFSTEKPYIQVGLTGGGGGSPLTNIFGSSDKNITIEYYQIGSDVLTKTEFSPTTKNSVELSIVDRNVLFRLEQTGYFFIDANSSITFTIKSTDTDLYIENEKILSSQNNELKSITKTFLRSGYYFLKLIYRKSSSNSFLDIKYSPNINFRTLVSANNYGGGSAASIGITLPSKYIIDKNLQTVKFVMGRSGFSEFNLNNPNLKCFLYGQPAGGNADRIANGVLKGQYNQILKSFLYDAPLLRNFVWRIGTSEQNSPDSDLIFVGKDVTQSQLNELGIKTELSKLYRIKSGDVLDISSTANVNDYLSIGYYIWNPLLGTAGIYNNYQTIYFCDYQAADRQYSALSGKFTVPSTFQSTDVLVIGFQDANQFRLDIKGLDNLTVNVSLSFIPTLYPGGDSYILTGSSTPAQTQNAYLGIIAGGGKTYNGQNLGKSSIQKNLYQGILYDKSNTSSPLNSVFENYITDKTVFLEEYNKAVNGNNGTNPLIGGNSVDLSVDSNKKYGSGGGPFSNLGTRGNYIFKGENLLYEIYVNSSSVYNVTLTT